MGACIGSKREGGLLERMPSEQKLERLWVWPVKGKSVERAF